MTQDDRLNFLILTAVCVAAAVVAAVVAVRGFRERPWTDQTKRAMFGATILTALAILGTVLHLN